MAILIWRTKTTIYPDSELTQTLVQQTFSDVIFLTGNQLCI